MTYLDLAQYLLHVMSATVQSDKLSGFNMQIVLTFEFLSYFSACITSRMNLYHKSAFFIYSFV